ncbi:MAG: hypothetical protein ACAI35_26470 [Candidatus Methylacidiphilales bacterium]|nr:hypothetical protein [Candidatus Methylacidiphilales bacterium]
MLFLPRLSAWQKILQLKIASQERDKQSNNERIAQYDKWKERDEWLKARVPLGDNLTLAQASLLEELQKNLAGAGVETVDRPFIDTSPVQKGAATSNSLPDDWIQLTARFSCTGTLEQVVRLSVELQQSVRFQTVSQYKIVADKDPNKVLCEMHITRWLQP